MFLSLVRPDRISSPMTRMPAVTIPSPAAVGSLEEAACMKRFLMGDFSRRAAFFFRPRSDAREPRPLTVAVSRRGTDTPCWRARAEIERWLREDIMARAFLVGAFAAVAAALSVTPASAEKDGVLRLGVLNDMSSVYSDFQGPGSVIAAQLAVEDFASQSKRKAEVVSADHLNKPDVGASIARRWLDIEGVDVILDLPNSAVALAVADIARDKNKV